MVQHLSSIVLSGLLFVNGIHCFAQNSFIQLQKKFKSNCADTFTEVNVWHDVKLIEQFLNQHPQNHKAWYTLAMKYYNLAINIRQDSLIEQSIIAQRKFIEYSPQKQRWYGFWNLALLQCYLKRCTDALQSLQTAKFLFPKMKEAWDTESENGILNTCTGSTRDNSP